MSVKFIFGANHGRSIFAFKGLRWICSRAAPSESFSKQVCLLHNPDEILLADLSITIPIGFIYHFLQLFVRNALPKFHGNSFEIAERNLSSLIVIEQSKRLDHLLPRISLTHLRRHHGQELVEIHLGIPILIDLGDQFAYFLLARFESQGAHGHLELLRVDGPRAIRVEEVECLANLLFLILGEFDRSSAFFACQRFLPCGWFVGAFGGHLLYCI
mmetsp:Transcript_34360/g.58296  ORF Transcript_34360/g.58296 Transcript_34360/m.58296 type:complete len:215 (+) Transcript_34360:1707-2351(+)